MAALASTAAALDLATSEKKKKKKKQKIYLRTSSKFGILQRFEERQQESTESQGAEEPNSCQSFAPVQKARSQSTLSADSSGSGSSEWRRIRTPSDFGSTKSPKASPKDCSPMEVRDYAMASSMPSYVPLPSPFLGTSMFDLPQLIPVSSWQPPQPPLDECRQVMLYNVPKKSKDELENEVQAAGFPDVELKLFPAYSGCQAVRIQFASSQEANDFHQGFVSGSFTLSGHDASCIQVQLGLFCHSCGSTVGELFLHCVQCGAALHEAEESRLSNSSDAPNSSDDNALRSSDASSVQSDES